MKKPKKKTKLYIMILESKLQRAKEQLRRVLRDLDEKI